MLSVMRSAVAVSLLLLASAAGDEASPSLRGGRASSEAVGNVTARAANETLAADAGVIEDVMLESMSEGASAVAVAGASGNESMAWDLADLLVLARNLSDAGVSVDAEDPEAILSADSLEPLLLMRGGWYPGGDKLWGSGHGMESINGRNVRYYDKGMHSARARCGGSHCALIVNPQGHRTVNQFHIHFVSYQNWGATLKRRLEKRVCARRGSWVGGGLPCHGKAAYFPGFPGVFSKAMIGGGIHHASVIAWPMSCGGQGTIVQLAYGCSIEHQIRGDFNPRHR